MLPAAISGKREQGGYVHHEEITQPCFCGKRWSGTEALRSDSVSEIVLDKGELHIHLNGAVPAKTVLEILGDEGTEIITDFNPERDLVRRSPCSSLAEYLVPWQLLRRLPKREENLRRLVVAVVSNLHTNGVRFVELRSSVLYLAAIQECSVPEALNRLITCINQATELYAMQWGLILTVTRGDYSSVHLAALLSAYDALGRSKHVVGIDLAGDEEVSYPTELPSLFRKAKDDFGLGITIHAGETGRSENVRTAIELFGADRIGHGTAAGSDPALMELLAKRDVCVEVCPISNRLTGAIPPEKAHPLRDFYEHGVPFVICSDNPAIHEQGLNEDYAAALAEGLPAQVLREQYTQAMRYSFIRGIS